MNSRSHADYHVVSDLHRPLQKSLTEKAGEVVSGQSQLSDNIEHYPPSLPVVAFKFSDEFKKEYPDIKQKSIQTLLRSKSWIVPNYELPPNVQMRFGSASFCSIVQRTASVTSCWIVVPQPCQPDCAKPSPRPSEPRKFTCSTA